MSILAVAIQRREWELVSLCLLVGVVEAAATLPPGAVEELLEVLAGLESEDARPQGGVRSPSTGLRTDRGGRR